MCYFLLAFDTARMRPSGLLWPIYRQQQRRAAGLLLSAPHTADIDR